MSTYVTTVQTPMFNLAPVPKLDLLDLVIHFLVWLLTLAVALKGEPACCDNPKLKREEGYIWCLSCGAYWKAEEDSDLDAKLDKSLKYGYHSVKW